MLSLLLPPWNLGSKTTKGTTWQERCRDSNHTECFYYLWSDSWGTERPSLSVCPQCPLLPRRNTTETLFRVPFKNIEDTYCQVLKIRIWVMVWDFIGILFLLLLIILVWFARSLLGLGGGEEGQKPQSSQGTLRWEARGLPAVWLPPTWTRVYIFPFPGWPMLHWMLMTSGPGRSQGGSQWSPRAFIAPSQVKFISLLTQYFHGSKQKRSWLNGCKERGQCQEKRIQAK